MQSHLLLIGSGQYGQFLRDVLQGETIPLEILDGEHALDVISTHPATHVVIATPNYTHAPLVRACLRAGKHVLCEKPLALTREDIADLYSLAADNHVGLHVGFVLLHHPFYQWLIQKSHHESLTAMFVANNATEGMLQPAWYWNKEQSGGWFMVSEIHWFHLFALLTDQTEFRVQQAGEVAMNGRDVATHCLLQSPTESRLSVDHRLDATYENASCNVDLIFGDRHFVIDDWVPRSFTLSNPDLAQTVFSELSHREFFTLDGSVITDTRDRDVIYADMIRANIQALLQNQSSPVAPVIVAHHMAIAAQALADSDE